MSFLSSIAPLRLLSEKTLDFLLPPLCLSCDVPVSSNRTLCAPCWVSIHFITSPFCSCCGAPFDVPVGDDMLCGSCIVEAPAFKSARAAMLYNDASKKLVLHFKHADRTHPAAALATWMARAGQECINQADYLIPVPLHRWRLFKRRYNQAALLAHELSRLTAKPALLDGLLRIKASPMQGHLNRKERAENVRGAFSLNPRHRTTLQGKTVSLIDDVLTTGATVNECSKILLKAGVVAVHVLTLARVRAYT